MKAAYIERFGDEDAFVYGDLPDPKVSPRHVLIRVKAAGINRNDLYRREGSILRHRRRGDTSVLGSGYTFPFVSGYEAAGVIEAVGPEVDDQRVGQRVVATPAGGSYAELVAVNAVGAVPLPDNLTFEEGASIPIVFLTSWYALVKTARIQAGETVLIQSGGSGVGMAGIQISKYFKTRVITTAGSDEKVAKAMDLGADLAINYQTQDFLPEVMMFTNGRGVDLVLESVGGEVLSKSILTLARMGRLIVVGKSSLSHAGVVERDFGMLSQFASPPPLDPVATLNALPDLNELLQKSATFGGFNLTEQMSHAGIESYGDAMAELAKILDLCSQKKMRTVVDSVFPLAKASEAHRYLEQRRNFGKVILRP